jgi:hypothetical protein
MTVCFERLRAKKQRKAAKMGANEYQSMPAGGSDHAFNGHIRG